MVKQENIKLIVNGTLASCPTGRSLQDYLLDSGIEPGKVVAEINGKILKPENFGKYVLNAGDQVEIIQFVGGG